MYRDKEELLEEEIYIEKPEVLEGYEIKDTKLGELGDEEIIEWEREYGPLALDGPAPWSQRLPQP